MKILITGATGFIGKELCKTLAFQGHELIAITRNRAKARWSIPAPHLALEWDFSSPLKADALKLLEGIDAVIHLAGESLIGKRWTPEIKKQLWDSRVENTCNLMTALESVQGAQPKVFISASAIGYYGDRGDETLDESSPPGQGFLAELCQKWEESLFQSPLKNTRKIAIRFGLVLGKEGGALNQMLPIFLKGLGGILGSGRQWMSWIHLKDLIAIIQECLNNESLSGPINGCSPHPVTNQEFTRQLAQSLHTLGVLQVPKFALNLALGEVSGALLNSQKVNPSRLLEAQFPFQYRDIHSALQAILGDSYSLGYREFHSQLWVSQPIHTVFQFFSNAHNLDQITPPWLNFRLISMSTPEIQKGTLIDYQLKLHRIPIRWRTEITDWDPPYRFTDIQLKGPYREWEHSHKFQELGKGTLIEDQVIYGLPGGFLGQALGEDSVLKDISKIFLYRGQRILEILEGRG